MSTIPKFNFSESVIKTEEELQASMESAGNSKFFRPGRYDVTIESVEYQGLAKDDRWGKFLLTLKGTGEKSIRAQVIVPFRGIEFVNKNGKPSKFNYVKFVEFMTAIGKPVKVEELETLLPAVWSNPDRTLVGLNVGIDVGYDRTHIRYDGKDEIGLKRYAIEYGDGSTLCDASGKVMVFNDYDSALAHAEANQIEIQRFSNVLGYTTPTAGNTNTSTNW